MLTLQTRLERFLTSAAASASTRHQDHASVTPGLTGCQTRMLISGVTSPWMTIGRLTALKLGKMLSRVGHVPWPSPPPSSNTFAISGDTCDRRTSSMLGGYPYV